MRFVWFVAGLALFALLARVGVAAPIEIHDAGCPRTFEVALDEVAISSPQSPRAVQTIASRSSLADLRRETNRRAAAFGQRVEWVLYEVEDGVRRGDPCILTEAVLFTVEPGVKAEALALRRGAVRVQPTALPETWRAVAADAGAALDLAAALRGEASVRSAELMLARRDYPRLTPNDVRFTNQWHLNNTGQYGARPGVDIRVTNVWDTYRGAGQYIAIIDDGLQHTHPDLAANSDTNLDYDLVYGDDDPNPELDPFPLDNALSKHGTACAGMAAAIGNNGMGVLGSAPEARLVGLRLILGYTTDDQKAEAFSWSNQIIQIKSNSWGPGDAGYTISGPGPLSEAALSNACFSGRGGRGTLFFWAAGNGAETLDNANYDGYANSMYTIAISALGPNGEAAPYSEPGANIVVCAPSKGSNTIGGMTGVWTTDRLGDYGYNVGGEEPEYLDPDYTPDFGGTSAATPLAAGVGALILQANPLLGWRDVQEILIRTATRVDEDHPGWHTNGAGFAFHHRYGAGLINASDAVALATTWSNLGPRQMVHSNQANVMIPIPDHNPAGIARIFQITNHVRVEHAVLTLSAAHPYRGDLEIELISPSHTTSVLAQVHNDDGNNYPSWKFMSVHHWGEAAPGVWEVRVRDGVPSNSGVLTTVRLTLYGTDIALSNRPPAFASLATPVTNSVGNPMVFHVYAPDLCDGDPVTLLASNLPAGAAFPTTNEWGTFIWTNAAPTGTYPVIFHAFDKDGYAEARVEVGVGSPTATVVFLETVGIVGTSGDSITTHDFLDRFDNDHLTISGNARVSDQDPSYGKSSRSGPFFVHVVATGDFFQIGGLDASGRSGLVLTYGVYKSLPAESGTNLLVEASTNGMVWTQLSPATPWLPTGSGTLGWYFITNALPPEFAARNLQVRFRFTGETAEWFLDDILLTGLKNVLDTDGDGLDDDWEVRHFGGLLTADAGSDWDGDQFSDRHEYRAGTEPTNAASLLKTGFLNEPGAAGFVVTWHSASNRFYQIARSTNLAEGFTGLASNLHATYPINTHTDAVYDGCCVYRVEVEE